MDYREQLRERLNEAKENKRFWKRQSTRRGKAGDLARESIKELNEEISFLSSKLDGIRSREAKSINKALFE